MHVAHMAELHTDAKPEASNMEENSEYGSIVSECVTPWLPWQLLLPDCT